MAKNTQTRLIAEGCRIRDTKKATCCSGFLKTVVSLGKKTQRLWIIALGLYSAFIVPVLKYSMGMWGLTPTEWTRFTDVSWGRSLALRNFPAMLCMKDVSAAQWTCQPSKLDWVCLFIWCQLHMTHRHTWPYMSRSHPQLHLAGRGGHVRHYQPP